MQGILYSQGVVNQFVLVLLLAIGLFYMCSYYKEVNLRNKFFDCVGFLCFMYILYGTIFFIWGDEVRFDSGDLVPSHLYMQNGLYTLLPFFSILFFFKSGELKVSHFQFYFFAILFVVVENFYYNQKVLLSNSLFGKTEFTNNVGYEFLAMFPMLIFIKNDLLKFASSFVLIIYIFFCMKRGAIIIGSLCFLYFFYKTIIQSSGKRRVIMVISSCLVLILSFYILYDFIEGSDYFNRRLEATVSGDSSGRDDLYLSIYSFLSENSDPLIFLFGLGANGSVVISGNYAHQDWLEFFSSNGLIGFLLLIYFFRVFYQQVKLSTELKDIHLQGVLLMSLFIVFTKSLFSMSVGNMHISLVLAIVYAISNINKKNEESSFIYR